MDIGYFQELIELAHRLNYREAAARLNMSQSALSKHVKALETEYGVRLFDRDRNSVALTPAGVMLVDYAQQIWSAYEKSKSATAASQQSRPIMIAGLVESPDENRTMGEVMHYVSSRGISRQVRMRSAGSMSASEQVEALHDGVIDCFIGYELMPFNGQDGVRCERLCELPLDIIVEAGSALASRSSLRYADMAGATFVHLAGPNFTPTWRLIESLLVGAGVPFTAKPVPTSSIYDYIDMNLAGCLLVMPRRREYERVDEIYPKIALVPVDEPNFRLGLDVAFLEGNADESLECLVEALRHCYSALFD